MILQGGYPFPILLSCIVFMILFVCGLRFRKTPESIYFTVTMALMSMQCIFSIYEILGVTLEDKLMWRNVQQIPLYYSPVMILGVIMSFIGISRRTIIRTVAILSPIILLYWILLFTDSYHHLIRDSVTLVARGQENVLQIGKTHLGLL
ncbi:hypothetical protein GC096_35045, partial [Paenibacillus sp. LMG 31461]